MLVNIKITKAEKSWLSILLVLFVIGFFYFLLNPSMLPEFASHREPLADPVSLDLLINDKDLEKPLEEQIANFHGARALPPPLAGLRQPDEGILGDMTPSDVLPQNKRIEVDLTRQRVYAYENDKKIFDFVVSTGKWGRTPTGEFNIWAKVKSQKMSGGNPAIGTYYYLPNVPYVMFFSNKDIEKARGFSFHGAYWHDNFGFPMSHGCINMKISDAQHLFYWASPQISNPKAWSTNANKDNPGTKVVIYGETPKG